MEWKRFCTFAFRVIADTLFPLPPKLETLSLLSSESLLSRAQRAHSDRVLSDLRGEAVFVYRDPLVRDAIRAFKYSHIKQLGAVFAETLYDLLYEELMYDTLLSVERNLVVIPIPLSRERLYERGFNQSEIIAEHFVGLFDTHMCILETALIRTRHTEKQALRASRAEREENIRGCFTVNYPQKISGKRILLIDDVITTGATMREARRVLLDAGAADVRCIAVAH